MNKLQSNSHNIKLLLDIKINNIFATDRNFSVYKIILNSNQFGLKSINLP